MSQLLDTDTVLFFKERVTSLWHLNLEFVRILCLPFFPFPLHQPALLFLPLSKTARRARNNLPVRSNAPGAAKLWPLSDIRTGVPAFIRDGGESEDSRCDTPAWLCAQLASLALSHSRSRPRPLSLSISLSLCVIYEGSRARLWLEEQLPLLQYDLLMKSTDNQWLPWKDTRAYYALV